MVSNRSWESYARLLRAWKGRSQSWARPAGQDVTPTTMKGLYSRSLCSVTTLKLFSFSNRLSSFSETSESSQSLTKESLSSKGKNYTRRRSRCCSRIRVVQRKPPRMSEQGPYFHFTLALAQKERLASAQKGKLCCYTGRGRGMPSLTSFSAEKRELSAMTRRKTGGGRGERSLQKMKKSGRLHLNQAAR